MPGAARISLLALVTIATFAGCGSSGDSIPADQGDVLLTRLDEVENAIESGNCDGAQDSAQLFVSQVDQLPDSVDSDVKKALDAGSERLSQLAADPEQCTQTGPSGFSGQQTTETPTTQPATTETTTTSTQEEEPKEPGGGGEQGGGNKGGGNEGGGGETGGGGGGDGGTGSGGASAGGGRK
jgi:hypothetical protein